MSGICTKHPHSSAKSASKCYAKYMQKRVDKRMGGKYAHVEITRYRQVQCKPPELVILKGIEIYYFYKGLPIRTFNVQVLDGQSG